MRDTETLCNNNVPDKDNKGRRCSKVATHYLINGSQVQGRVCEQCARLVIKEATFLKMRPIN
jgi:hypothetical protein